MARFHDVVGYGVPVENPPDSGIWPDSITETVYSGNIIKKARNLEPGENIHSDIRLSHSISILADEFAIQNYIYIKYVKWGGVRWTVTTVEVERPRLILTLGDVYNGPLPEPEEP